MENVNVNNAEAKTRIFAAADKLYEACGRETFPTVDAVRREAKAAMGDVSSAMKEWRKNQTAQAVVHEIQAPDVIMNAAKVLAIETWKQAQELATESLKSAQAAWDAERAESESMRAEMSKAFDDQVQELETVKADLESANSTLEKLKADLEESCAHLDDATQDVLSSQKKIDDQADRIVALEAQIKDMQMQANESSKKLDVVIVEKTEAEKKLAVLETKLAAEQEKFAALEKAHDAENEKTKSLLDAYKDSQIQDRKALAAAEDKSKSDLMIIDGLRADLDASQKEVARLLAGTSSESSSGSEWA